MHINTFIAAGVEEAVNAASSTTYAAGGYIFEDRSRSEQIPSSSKTK